MAALVSWNHGIMLRWIAARGDGAATVTRPAIPAISRAVRGDSGEISSRLWPRLAVGNENRLQSTSILRRAISGPYGLIGQQRTTSGKLPCPKGSQNDAYIRKNYSYGRITDNIYMSGRNFVFL